jgi:dihydroorotate dehydrogenase (fumarate)
MIDTATSYVGFHLAHPFAASASPLGRTLDTVKQLEDGGCAAIVLPSLFEEQITLAADGRIHHMDPAEAQWRAALSDFPPEEAYAFGPHEYAEHIGRVKRSVAIPVIGSLNGTTPESWLTFARVIEQAGADALELNLYEVITRLDVSGAAIEHQLTEVVRELKAILGIPIIAKLSPFFAAPGNVARRLDEAGVDGIVLFNRFYQPDIDTATPTVVPKVDLSTSAELLLRLRWLAILHGRVRPSLGLTGGVAVPNDGVKAILAGADLVHMTSAVLRNGPAYFSVMKKGLEEWMEQHEVERLADMCGRLSLKHTVDPAAFERASYLRVLQSWPTPGAGH